MSVDGKQSPCIRLTRFGSPPENIQLLTVNLRRTHPKIQPWLFGYNVYAAVEKAYTAEPY